MWYNNFSSRKLPMEDGSLLSLNLKNGRWAICWVRSFSSPFLLCIFWLYFQPTITTQKIKAVFLPNKKMAFCFNLWLWRRAVLQTVNPTTFNIYSYIFFVNYILKINFLLNILTNKIKCDIIILVVGICLWKTARFSP